ncbi:hypothetical protein FACS1894152_3830 [Bacilli bacterium]|nr:hypothetical protein FACS1894152_3830 [Bacilli bacterium]
MYSLSSVVILATEVDNREDELLEDDEAETGTDGEKAGEEELLDEDDGETVVETEGDNGEEDELLEEGEEVDGDEEGTDKNKGTPVVSLSSSFSIRSSSASLSLFFCSSISFMHPTRTVEALVFTIKSNFLNSPQSRTVSF